MKRCPDTGETGKADDKVSISQRIVDFLLCQTPPENAKPTPKGSACTSPDKWDALRRAAEAIVGGLAGPEHFYDFHTHVTPRAILELLSELRGMERGGEGQYHVNTNLRFVTCKRKRTRGNVYDYDYWECAHCGWHPGSEEGPPTQFCGNCKRSPYTDNPDDAVHLIRIKKDSIGYRFEMVRLATLSVTEGVDGWIDCKQELPRDQEKVLAWDSEWQTWDRVIYNDPAAEHETPQWEVSKREPFDSVTHWQRIVPPQSGVDGREK